MKKNSWRIASGLILIALFVLWTALVVCVDVRAIGPEGSSVGFAAVIGAFHALTGVHMGLYTLTDWLGIVPFVFVFGFAVLGLHWSNPLCWLAYALFCRDLELACDERAAKGLSEGEWQAYCRTVLELSAPKRRTPCTRCYTAATTAPSLRPSFRSRGT